MIKKKRMLALALISCLITGTLAGCNQSSTNSSSLTDSTAQSDTKEKRGKDEVLFTFARNEDIITFDYANSVNLINLTINSLLNDTLVYTDHAGGFSPRLATEWNISEDGLSCTFKLREGVRFHNGEALTSECVKITFERMAQRTDLGQHAEWASLTSVETPDELTAIMHFSEPYGAFLINTAQTPIIPAQAYAEQGDAIFDNPIGAGPFSFVSWNPGSEIVFQRFDDYWGWGDEKTNIDRIIYKPIMEDTTRVSGIRTGELDLIESTPIDQVEMLQKEGAKVELFNNYGNIYLGMNCHEGSPFFDKNARLALAYAIDRQIIVDSILGGGKPSVWPTEEGCLGYNPESAGYAFDLEKAKEYLGQSDYKGEELTMIAAVGKTTRSKEVTQAIMSMMTDAGFKVNLEMLENAAYNERRSSGNYDLHFSGITPIAGDTGALMNRLYLMDAFNSGGVPGETVELIRQVNTEVDSQRRDELARKAMSVLMEECAPNVYLYQIQGAISMQKNIEHVKIFGDGVMDLSNIRKNE